MFQADLCADPVDIYNYVYSQSIGSNMTLFYESWALVLEHKGNLKKADEVYNLGIQRSAQPLERLQRQHRLTLDTERMSHIAGPETFLSRFQLEPKPKD